VVPRPDSGSLRIWLGTGGNPQSSVRAGLLGLPITYGIIGGNAARFAPLADLYRRAAQQARAPAENIKVSIANPGLHRLGTARGQGSVVPPLALHHVHGRRDAGLRRTQSRAF
jgi:hypothetical protein